MKPTTHSKAFLYTHLVWATSRRLPLISMSWFDTLRRRASSAAGKDRAKIIAFGGVEDHIHVLLQHRPDARVSQLVRQIKAGMSHWLRNQARIPAFKWQEGYAAFSISADEVPGLKRYIQHQPDHHSKGDAITSWELP